jgi:CDP-glycerol glycerophosphotransferase (TagB/SpsB family)
VNYEYDLVIQIGSPPQFFGIRDFVNEISKRKNIKYTCFVPVVEDEYSKEMFDLTYNLVKKTPFKVTRVAPKSCKVYLAAWPRGDTKYKYILRYTYSLLTAKPNPVYLPDSQRRYHGILSQNIFEYETLRVYANTYFVPNLKYIGWKKKPTSGRNILFLPTWNAASLDDVGKINANDSILPALQRLKESGYHIIIKAHPLTLSDPKAKQEGERLNAVADEHFNSETAIQDALAVADLVVSDNSGAIYEALYSNTPVIVYGDKTNARHLGSIDTAHHRWIQQGVIENPNSPEELLDAVKRGLEESYIKRQQEVSDKTFKKVYDKSAINSWTEVIDKYLGDEVNQDYIELHDRYMDFIDEKDQRIKQLSDRVDRQDSELSELNSIIHNERNSGVSVASKRLLRALLRKSKITKRRV